MSDVVHRVLVLVWFLAYMACIYLALHMVVARLIRSPDSRVLWFFSVVTGPLTRPIASVLPPGSSEARLRLIALVAYAAVWFAMRLVLAHRGGVGLG
jgi:hypothetical protein